MEEVGVATALHLVIAGTAEEHVPAVGGNQLVVTRTAIQAIVAAEPVDPVVAAIAPDLIVTA